jgi:hypothetical protein
VSGAKKVEGGVEMAGEGEKGEEGSEGAGGSAELVRVRREDGGLSCDCCWG